jgi:hypothetical protein
MTTNNQTTAVAATLVPRAAEVFSFTPVRGTRAGVTSNAKQPTHDDKKAAAEYFSKNTGLNIKQAVTYLLEKGWTTSAICDFIRYPSDGRLNATTGQPSHRSGDKMRPQHVNSIRLAWQAAKAEQAELASK